MSPRIPKTPLFWLVSSFSLCFLGTFSPAPAQIAPDGTLPTNITTPDSRNFTVDGGNRAGSNLFHSFREFSVPTGGAAFFNNATDIQNIFSRVTGGSISNIDGLIRANGTANFFLLNPNGIIFGANASLNIGGSFIASTASSLNFADGKSFSATNPQNTPLLTVSVPVGLQFPGMPKSIINNSVVTIPNQPLPVGLAVQPGRTLALVGGDITLDGGRLTAPGGRIELGSVGRSAKVSLTPLGIGWALGYSGVRNFGNIQLSQAGVSTSSTVSGGDIQVQGNRVALNNGSVISTSTFGDGAAGNLTVRGSESVELTGNGDIGDLVTKIFQNKLTLSDLSNGLFTVSFGAGAAGNLTVDTRRFTVRDGAAASSTSFVSGVGGNLTVTAPGGSVELVNGGLLAGTAGEQNSGNLTIHTGRLLVQDGGLAATTTLGSGRGGNLTVNANLVELTGTSAQEYTLLAPRFTEPQTISSGLYTLSSLGAGRAGDLTIKTGRLLIQNGAIASTTTLGGLRAGDLIIQATESVELNGTSKLNETGKLQILEEILNQNSDLSPRIDPSDLRSGLFTSGFGGGTGNLRIDTRRLTVRNGGVVSASTFGDGSGGNLTINTSGGVVELIGGGLLTGTTGSQNSGTLTINTGQLRLSEGAVVTTSTVEPPAAPMGETGTVVPVAPMAKAGRGGDLTVNAQSVELTGRSAQRFNLPIIFAELQPTPTGLEPKPLDPQPPIPSGLYTLTFGSGDAGNLRVNTNQLRLRDDAVISTSTFGTGRGGDLIIRAPGGLVDLTGTGSFEQILIEIFSLKFDPSNVRSGLFTSSFGSGQAGKLTIETGRLIARNGATISASTFGEGKGGDLTVRATNSLELIDSGLLTGTVSTDSNTKAGDITIDTGRLIARNGGLAATSTLFNANGGNLSVKADSIDLRGASANGQVASGLFTLTFGAQKPGDMPGKAGDVPGKAGDLTINTETLSARDGAFVASSTFGKGKGGNLTVIAPGGLVELSGPAPTGERFSSGLRANALDDDQDKPPLPNFIRLILPIIGDSLGTGEPGSLKVETGALIVRNQAEVAVNIPGNQNAGTVTINADAVALVENSQITAAAAPNTGGKAGTVQGNSRIIFDTPDSKIDVSSPQGQQGVVAIRTAGINPTQGFVRLPEGVDNQEAQIALVCSADTGQSQGEFIITGRGGLPPSPSEPLTSDAVRIGSETPQESSENLSNEAMVTQSTLSTGETKNSSNLPPPAQGWLINSNGDVVLTASAPTTTFQVPWMPQGDCHVR
ncbi:hypothetical protein BCD67_13400 [Oscillatoriales cyanobacterium USR001]|nr:hypothetical protein BCD67_13400 [Oscillatoriales cyanobacterium USR001]